MPVYPFFLIVPGMLMVMTAASSTRFLVCYPFILLMLFVPAVLGRLWIMCLCLPVILILRASFNDIGLVSAGFLSLGTVMFAVGTAARCPRCETPITQRKSWFGGPQSAWCVVCGRSRLRVWPFQYALRPQDWDGEYHDEGGGPPSPDSVEDWRRDLVFRRWQKRRRTRPAPKP